MWEGNTGLCVAPGVPVEAGEAGEHEAEEEAGGGVHEHEQQHVVQRWWDSADLF